MAAQRKSPLARARRLAALGPLAATPMRIKKTRPSGHPPGPSGRAKPPPPQAQVPQKGQQKPTVKPQANPAPIAQPGCQSGAQAVATAGENRGEISGSNWKRPLKDSQKVSPGGCPLIVPTNFLHQVCSKNHENLVGALSGDTSELASRKASRKT